MPYNGSGTFTPEVDFTTEAASPPIEIAKLDDLAVDFAEGLSNVITADGQTNPTANIKLNGFRLINVAAPTALTDAVTATTLIDQELCFYVDSGSANTYAITPSPAIAAYEEGQRFVFRAANASSGASTLNVNGLGAIAIQTADGSALLSNSILAGGFYEVTYDANATPDRWVLTSPASRLPDGMLSGNVALKGSANTFTVAQTISAGATTMLTLQNSTNSVTGVAAVDSDEVYFGATTNHPVRFYANNFLRFEISNAGDYDFKAGLVTTNNASASEVGYKGAPSRSVTATGNTAASDAGGKIEFNGTTAGQTFTLDADPPDDSVILFVNRSDKTWTISASGGLVFAGVTGNRTLGVDCMGVATHGGSGVWHIAGQFS